MADESELTDREADEDADREQRDQPLCFGIDREQEKRRGRREHDDRVPIDRPLGT